MNYLISITMMVFVFNQASVAQNWYVTGTGDNNNTGKSVQQAFRTLQKAADAVLPGETVWIGDGIYSRSDLSGGGAVLNISKSGRPGTWITWKALKDTHPELRPIGWGGIVITGSYHVLNGLKITGNNDALVLADAQADAKKPAADGAV